MRPVEVVLAFVPAARRGPADGFYDSPVLRPQACPHGPGSLTLEPSMVANQPAQPGPSRSSPPAAPPLHEVLRQVELERERLRRARWRQLLILGVALSLLTHISLMILLGVLRRGGPGGAPSAPVSIQFAILQEEALDELSDLEFEDPPTQPIDQVADLAEDIPADLAAEAPEALEVSAAGAVPALGAGGAGGTGESGGLQGGGAGTSFFGIASRGTRFAYIVDRSGSMGQGRKMATAAAELEKSLEALPDYAQFFVVLFSSDYTLPPMQQDWLRARRSTVRNLVQWLRGVPARGGTDPSGAFQLVLGLEVRPDVIYFLTDGEIPGMGADFVADLNKLGKRVTINTIAFGDPASQELLKEIARDSGGVYRFVPSD
jgi:hypothetical protein